MDDLEPYFRIAEQEAKQSPCVRRQYGAVIVYPGFEFLHVSAHNMRIGQCCNGFCIRERLNVQHNGSVEVGAEIHSETAVLLNRLTDKGVGLFVLVGFDAKTGMELIGESLSPCHTCTQNMIYSGFRYIYVRDKARKIVSLSLYEMLERREASWLP